MDKNLAVVYGGESISVQMLDGRTEVVTVRLVKVKEYPQLIGVIEDEEKLAEFVCGKDPGWAETLTPQSILDIAEKARDLNFLSLGRWMEGQVKLKGKLVPLAQGAMGVSSELQKLAPK